MTSIEPAFKRFTRRLPIKAPTITPPIKITKPDDFNVRFNGFHLLGGEA